MFPSHYTQCLIGLLPSMQVSGFNGPWYLQTVLFYSFFLVLVFCFFKMNWAHIPPRSPRPITNSLHLLLLIWIKLPNYVGRHRHRLFNQFHQLARLFPGRPSLFIRAEVMWHVARDAACRGEGGQRVEEWRLTGIKKRWPFNKPDARSRLPSLKRQMHVLTSGKQQNGWKWSVAHEPELLFLSTFGALRRLEWHI